MFYVTVVVYTFGAVVYCVLGRGSIQPWAVESAVLRASEVQVEVELNGADALLNPAKHSSSAARKNSASEPYRSDDTTL